MSNQSIKITLNGIKGKSVILKGEEIYDLNLLIPLTDGRYDNFGCSIEINGYILNDKNLIIFNEWGFAGYYSTKEKISIQVEIVNGGKVLRAYKVTNAVLEKYTEIEDEGSGYGCYNLLFKFSKSNLTNIEEKAKVNTTKVNTTKAEEEKIYNDAQKEINKTKNESKGWERFK